MHAVRNIRLCTKDCLCLYVCPTGASDTENGQIDFAKCAEGCRACVDACISHAISLVPETFPQQKAKDETVKQEVLALAASKVKQETSAALFGREASTPEEKQMAKAMEISSKMMAEDLYREVGYMVPQNTDTKMLLESLLQNPPADFPEKDARRLLELLNR
ncbi:MAG: 4Fe-4S ferredoxin [Erysipelotrichia bacterium]|nr:4Fe-4S ferredoxin [Erysipelotrichia bacterium]